MASNVTRMPTQQQMTAPGTQQGNWVWDGSNWVCGSCDDGGGFPYCPPSGYPPAGCPPWYSGANSPPWYPGANAGVSFGLTAPLNPVRGHFWWNGRGLAMFDGAVWVDTATGAIVPPDGSSGAVAGASSLTTHVFSISVPVTLPMTAGAWQIVPFTSTPAVDTGSGWDAVTYKFKPTRAGQYLFNSRVAYPGGTTNGLILARNDPGTGVGSSNAIDTTSVSLVASTVATAGWMTATDIAMMNGTTDYVRLWAVTGGSFLGSSSPILRAWLLP